MMNIQESFIPDPGFGYSQIPTADDTGLARLKEAAQRYCPEDWQAERQAVLPDDELHLEKLEAGFKMASYYSTEDWMNLDIEVGNLPPLKEAHSEEAPWQDVLAILNSASNVQLWWDQYLPSAVADVHKPASQKCFDCSATPTEIAEEQQAAMDEWLADNA